MKHSTWHVNTVMPISYSVSEYPDIFSSNDPDLFGERTPNPRRFVVIDKTVNELYGKKIRSYFDKHAITADYVVLETSEEDKSLSTLQKILTSLEAFQPLRRKEPIIAIGGGVLLDVVGMAANLYRRGTPFIRVPTTLVGLIDAGIGVKTGINFRDHKNRLGTYYHPAAVYIDPTFLTTLSRRDISSGLAEILKIGLIKDASLFALLEKYGAELIEKKFQNVPKANDVLNKAIKGMLEELEPNLWEHKLERLVDFGHTFSTGLEMEALPALRHGEAVNLDMAVSSVIAYKRKLLSRKELDRIISVMKQLDLPVFHSIMHDDLLFKSLEDSTSHRDGKQRFPLPSSIGNAKFVHDITREEIISVLQTLKEYSRGNNDNASHYAVNRFYE